MEAIYLKIDTESLVVMCQRTPVGRNCSGFSPSWTTVPMGVHRAYRQWWRSRMACTGSLRRWFVGKTAWDQIFRDTDLICMHKGDEFRLPSLPSISHIPNFDCLLLWLIISFLVYFCVFSAVMKIEMYTSTPYSGEKHRVTITGALAFPSFNMGWIRVPLLP